MIEKLSTNKPDVIFKIVNIFPEEATQLINLFVHNEGKHIVDRYFSSKSVLKIEKLLFKYKNNLWNPMSVENFNSRSIIIFFKDDHYQSFYEGKHRLFSLSKIEDKEFKLPFVCAIGWPGTLKKLRNENSKNKGFHREFIEECVLPFKTEIENGGFSVSYNKIERIYGK